MGHKLCSLEIPCRGQFAPLWVPTGKDRQKPVVRLARDSCVEEGSSTERSGLQVAPERPCVCRKANLGVLTLPEEGGNSANHCRPSLKGSKGLAKSSGRLLEQARPGQSGAVEPGNSAPFLAASGTARGGGGRCQIQL